jgi:solute carrier family 10 (sodium/bile acid cotransporter), member 7
MMRSEADQADIEEGGSRSDCVDRDADDQGDGASPIVNVSPASVGTPGGVATLPERSHEIGDGSAAQSPSEEKSPGFLSRCLAFYMANEFVILILTSIGLAKAYPPLGAEYIYPEYTATWLAVCITFFLAGLGLKTSELRKAVMARMYFNSVVQSFNFFVDSAIVFGISRLLLHTDVLTEGLADGMVICSCLPMTINTVLVLTKSGGGDESSAVFNAAAGNLIGVVLSPLLILGYLGMSAEIDVVEVFYRLSLRVLVPLFVGQLVQKFSTAAVAFVTRNKRAVKRSQELLLVFIVYTVFCKTFSEDERKNTISQVFLMIVFVVSTLLGLMVLSWYSLRFLFPTQPELVIMGLFGCTHKTVATGTPLITAMYEGNPNIGSYMLPLLIWHSSQIVIGSYIAPKLARWVEGEKKRLGISSGSTGVATSDEASIEIGDASDNRVCAATVGGGTF